MQRRRLLSFQRALSLCLILLPGTARAGELIGDRDTEARLLKLQTFLGDLAQEQVIVERAEVDARGEYLAWIRAFPEEPRIDLAEADYFDRLNKTSKAPNPLYVGVRKLMLKTSLIGRIFERITRSKIKENEDKSRRVLEVLPSTFTVVEGAVVSSTITRKRSLPKTIDRWLDANGFELSLRQQRQLMQYCERGWFITLVAVDVSAMEEDEIGVIGPIIYRFDGDVMVHPTLLVGDVDVDFEYWIASDTAHVPNGLLVSTDGLPGQRPSTDNGFSVSFHQSLSSLEIDDTSPLADFEFGPTIDLVYGKARTTLSVRNVQTFSEDSSLPALPDQLPRRSLTDLFYCLLLGIAPIFLAPESWLFYWLRHQGKLERTRVNPNPIATKVWPVYCIGVGLYWVASQSSGGQIAGVLPLVFGLWALRTQETPSGRVLVSFKKPKKKVRSSKEPKA